MAQDSSAGTCKVSAASNDGKRMSLARQCKHPLPEGESKGGKQKKRAGAQYTDNGNAENDDRYISSNMVRVPVLLSG
jgi:hypothetical protein